MNEELLDRLRNPQFRPALRGYDRLEVEALLHEVADLIESRGLAGAANQSAGELPGVAERVDAIVAAATEAAEHLTRESTNRADEVTREAEQAAEHARREAEGYAAQKREDADRYAAETRSAAEREAAQVREETQRMAQASAAAAEEQAAEMLREAELERDRVRASIVELREQRQAVVESIERMRGNLDSMVGSVQQGTEQFIALDPAGEDSIDEASDGEALIEPEEDFVETLEPDTGEEEGERRAKLAALFDDEDEDEDDEPIVHRYEDTASYEELDTGEDDEWAPEEAETDERPAESDPADATQVLQAEPERRLRDD